MKEKELQQVLGNAEIQYREVRKNSKKFAKDLEKPKKDLQKKSKTVFRSRTPRQGR